MCGIFLRKNECFLLLSFFLMQLFVSCKSEPPSPIVIKEDPLVIQELSPLPRAIVSARAEEYESVYSIFRIIEVSEVNGVQQFFLARLGSDRTGIDVGVSESIAEDEKFEKIIGKFTIIEIFGDFFRCEIEELDYKIGAAAYIRIKTGEKLKEI